MPDPPRHPLVVIAVALLLVGVAVGVTWTTPFVGVTTIYLFALAAVTVAGSFGGALGGGVATIAAAAAIALLLVPPPQTLGIGNADDVLRFGLFIALCVMATVKNWRHHRTSRRLRHSEELARIAIDKAPALVVASDAAGKVVVFNPECECVTGRTVSDVIGQPLIETLVPADSRADVATRFDSASEEDLAQPHRTPWATEDGSERLIEWRWHRLAATAGTMTIGFGRDVTEQHRLEGELRTSLARADAAEHEAAAAAAARERFIATMSHELRGPIIAVSGWARLLATTATDPNTARIAERISRSGVLMQRLINDVQELAAIDAGKVALRPTRVMLDEIATGAVDAAAPIAASRNITLHRESNGPVPIWGDRDRLYQAVANLVDNALKFTPDGGRISIAVKASEHDAEVLVEDSGPGIADADTHRVFEPFWQSTHARGGVGLGLPLVQQIAHLHGGTAQIRRSRPDGGTIASVTLPRDTEPSVESSTAHS